MPPDLSPTTDLLKTFAELEELKTILRAGSRHLDVQAVGQVQAAGGALTFPVLVASQIGRAHV